MSQFVLCHECKLRRATYFISPLTGGQTTSQGHCRDCYEKLICRVTWVTYNPSWEEKVLAREKREQTRHKTEEAPD